MFCPCHTRDKGFSLLRRLWWTFSLWHTSPILVSCKTPPCALSLYLSIKLGQRDIFLMYIFPASISPCYFPIRPLVGFLLRVQLSLPASVWMVKDKYTLTVNHDNHMRWWDETVVYCPDFSLPLSLSLSLSLYATVTWRRYRFNIAALCHLCHDRVVFILCQKSQSAEKTPTVETSGDNKSSST